jgi:uncharacterized protein (DUF2236 family)
MAASVDVGIYGPNSVNWRVNREQIMLLGGGRALLLQLAHPMVAAGVAQHSDFAADPMKRLRRTLDATLAIVFGTTDEAERAAAQVRAVHVKVRGVLTEDVGRYSAGTPYEANNPDYLRWVGATLLDTSIRVYELMCEPLSRADLNRFYEESKVFVRMLGVPDDYVANSIDDFRAYFDAMLASDEIAVGEVGRKLAHDVLHPKVRWVPPPVFGALGIVTAGLLPGSVRERFRLPWSPTRERAFRTQIRMARIANRGLPARLRLFPQAREALRRVSSARVA